VSKLPVRFLPLFFITKTVNEQINFASSSC
jgi:hypothetical protein